MTTTHTVNDLVTRVWPNVGHAPDFMKEGSNYRVTATQSDGAGGQHIRVRGSNAWFSSTLFRTATLDDAYNPAPAGDKALVDGTLPPQPASPLTKQEGGDHYKNMPKGYQPYEIAHALGLRGPEMNVVKYTLRHGKKGDKVKGAEDIRKAIHTLQVILALDYPGL